MSALRPDLAAIASAIEPGTRVLDIGCGDGALLAELRASKGVDARGIEIDGGCVERCVAQGLSVVAVCRVDSAGWARIRHGVDQCQGLSG